MKAKLSQIANNFEILNKTHFEVLQQIAKEVEVNLTTKGIFDNLKRIEFNNHKGIENTIQEQKGLNAKISNKKYKNISFANLFIGSLVTVPASTLFETNANEIVLVDDQRWKEKYKKQLDAEIIIEKTKYTLTDFILLYREKFPEIMIVVEKNSLAVQKVGLDQLITIEKGTYKASQLLRTELQKLNLSFDLNQEALIIKSTQDLNNEKQLEEFFRLASKPLEDGQKDKLTNKSIAQKLETPIFHDFTNLSMEETIQIISKDCNINILWDSKVEEDIKKENTQLSSAGMTANNVLKWLLANSSLVYTNIEQKFLLIKKAETYELAVEATISDIKKTETGVMIACYPTIPFDLSQEYFKSKVSLKNTEKNDLVLGMKIIAIANNQIYFEVKNIDLNKEQKIQLYINKVR